MSDEQRAHMGDVRRGKTHSPKTRALLRKLATGRSQSPETRRKKSLSMKKLSRGVLGEEGPLCDCCGYPTGGKRHRDHSHETGQRRGELCFQCNRGIGLFLDKPELLEKAETYLRRFQ